MEYYLILTVLILGIIVTFGMYLTITTIANKIFEKTALGHQKQKHRSHITAPFTGLRANVPLSGTHCPK